MNSQQPNEPLRSLISRLCPPNSCWQAPSSIDPALAEQSDIWYTVQIIGAIRIYRRCDIDRNGDPVDSPVLTICRKTRAELDELLWPSEPAVEEPEVNKEQFAEASRVLSDPEATIEAKEAAGRTYWRYVFQEEPDRPEYDDDSSE
jgi:hypothetical protein